MPPFTIMKNLLPMQSIDSIPLKLNYAVIFNLLAVSVGFLHNRINIGTILKFNLELKCHKA